MNVGDKVRFTIEALSRRNWSSSQRPDRKPHTIVTVLPYGDVTLENGTTWSRSWLESDEAASVQPEVDLLAEAEAMTRKFFFQTTDPKEVMILKLLAALKAKS